MSELVNGPKYVESTGVKTSTFYGQNKLVHAFIRTQPTLVNDKPNQTNKNRYTKKSYNKHPQSNKREKLPMFGKGTSRRKLYKTNGRNAKSKSILSDIEKPASCKTNNKTDLQMGKRSSVKMGDEDGEELKMCKKMKLDMNKNIESNEKSATQSELCTNKNFEIEQDLEKEMSETEELSSENRSSSPNVDGKVLITDQWEPSMNTNKKCENGIVLEISSSSCESGDSLEGINQNNAQSCRSQNRNGSNLITDERGQSHTINNSEDDIFGTPRSFCRSENSLDGNAKSKTASSSSSNTNDNISVADQTTNEPGYDILGFGNLSSQNKDKNSRASRKKMGSLDAFFSIENTRTSKTGEKLSDSKTRKKPKDSGFVESFRILGEFSPQEERNCSSTNTSPLLFSQSSTSTGYSGSSKSKSVSPDSQSSITKYFTPLRKSTSITALKNSIVSPTKGKRTVKGRKATSPSVSPVANKKEQMFLDLGQKNFGHITCPTCNMVYTSAQPEDEAYHVKFHQKVVTSLCFNGWKTERVVEHFDDGRVIVVLPQDSPWHLKKVASVRTVVDDELGFSSETSLRMQDSKTYLFIADKKVVGCVVAVGIEEAFPLLPCTTNGDKNERSEQGAWCCSSAPARAQCGISRVWVLQQYRRKRIASRILDCVRSDFMFGGIVSKELLAFSDPTPLGKQLAESYCGTENFLVFR